MALPQLARTNQLKAAWATVLSYGPAGAGKTYSIRTIKEVGMNPIILATELGETKGFLTLKDIDVPFLPIDSHEQMIETLRALKRKKGKVEWDQIEYGCVILDSITHWGEMPLDRFVSLKGWSDLATPEDRKDPRMAYAYLSEKGRQLYKELFELSAHLYVIAREGMFGGGDVPLFAAPELPGQKLPREIPGWPDATVRLRVIGGKHQMLTKGEGGSPARVRVPQDMPELPGRCNPNIAALIKFMCGDANAHKLLVPESEKPPVQGKKS